jgi:hypothetical protein
MGNVRFDSLPLLHCNAFPPAAAPCAHNENPAREGRFQTVDEARAEARARDI